MTRQAKVLLLGILTGLFGVVVSSLPGMQALEENTGLDLLFKLRGTRTPPADVVVVSIDKLSAQALGLPNEPVLWPRSIHAQMVNRIADAGASVIVPDIFFREPRGPGEDQLLAQAIRDANRVVLFAYTRKDGTVTKRYGVALDQVFSPDLAAGLEFSWRDLEVPVTVVTPLPGVDEFNCEDRFGRAYVLWTQHPRLSVGAEYQYGRFARDDDFTGELEGSRVWTSKFPLSFNYFHPHGYSD